MNTIVCKEGIECSILITAESRTYIHELYPTETMRYPNRIVAGGMRSLIASRVVLVQHTSSQSVSCPVELPISVD